MNNPYLEVDLDLHWDEHIPGSGESMKKNMFPKNSGLARDHAIHFHS